MSAAAETPVPIEQPSTVLGTISMPNAPGPSNESCGPSSRRRPAPPRRTGLQPAQRSALWYKKIAQTKIKLNEQRLEVAKIDEEIAKEKLLQMRMDREYKAALLESAKLDVEIKRRQLANINTEA